MLSFVGHAGWRGQFVVHTSESVRSVFFEGGNVTGAQSSVQRERLGEVLYRYGVLTREQVSECGDPTVAGKLRFGEVAVSRGLLTPEQLFGQMARQIEEIFYGLLLVSDGTFFFLDGYDDAELASRHALSFTPLLRDGIRRMHEMRYFRARIPSEDHVPHRAAGREPPDHDATGVYAAIDGQRSVAAICRALGTDELAVTRTLFQLVQTGHLVVRRPTMSAIAAVEVYNAAIALLLRELDAMDEGDAVREQLATFANKAPFAQIFKDAGPADDGTLIPEQVAQNIAAKDVPPSATDQLPGWLHDYASYALFLARPHLRRKQSSAHPERPRLSMRVTELLNPLTPPSDRPKAP
jgi:hypothetical protein